MLLARYDPVTERTQTLPDHTKGVMAIAGKTAQEGGLGETATLAAMLHDMGKASAAFEKHMLEDGPPCVHACYGARYLRHTFPMQSATDVWLQYIVSAAICGHHTGLPDFTAPDGTNSLEEKIFTSQALYYDEVVPAFLAHCFSAREIQAQYDKARDEFAAYLLRIRRQVSQHTENQIAARQFYFALTARYLHSALIDADRWDAYTWTVERQPEPPAALPLWGRGLQGVEARLAGFARDSELACVRGAISEACTAFAANGPGIYQLNVPTGSGKTLAVLRYALKLSEQEGYRRIFYVAPYRTILEQNAQEVRDALPECLAVLEHHSDVQFEDGEDDSERLRAYMLAAERWRDSPVILTTMVQFLQTLFIAKSASARRFQALTRSVIVLDEVQSVPVPFLAMLNTALNFLHEMWGCTVILCTATQPKLAEVAIPVRLGSPANLVPPELQTHPVFRRTVLIDRSAEPPMDSEALGAFALEQHRSGSVLVILNTRTAARRVYEALRDTVSPEALCFLTTSMCSAHRSDTVKMLRERLNAGLPVLCVSTQLIEAGVDVSFDCVIRSLAGLDSIAQAAGRCNRHGKSGRPMPVYIVRSADEVLDQLPDIYLAQQAVIPVLEAYRENPERFGHSLLSNQAIDLYYSRYYFLPENVHKQLYPVDELYTSTTLYDLLTENNTAKNALAEHGKELPNHKVMNQAVDTAARLVQVIASQGRDVLAPYGDKGRAIIAALCGRLRPDELRRWQRKAQRYTLSLFDKEVGILRERGALHPAGESGIVYLSERFYDARLGVQLTKLEQETILF
ncbi:CRISPR-associated helicase Cas3' [Ruminococcaceae bacterium OttesenSCG-928-L11]|nr:CRISPR-associated helicase Cas3' [Ruminococcaceae bacterium OttesenSCG-928-L11]